MTFSAIEPTDFPWFDFSRYTFSLGLTSGDSAYLSGHSASEYDPDEGRIVIRGGMADQTRTAYSKVERILDAAGLNLQDVVRIVENVTIAGLEHYAEAAEVRQELFGIDGPTTETVCVDRLLRPSAWIEVEVVASRGGGVLAAAGYGTSQSPAREANGQIYLPSCLPIGESGDIVGDGGLEAQIDQCYRNAQSMLEAAGLGCSSIAKVVEFISAPAAREYDVVLDARRRHLAAPYPCVSTVVMGRLPVPGALVQLSVIASRARLEPVDPWSTSDRMASSPALRSGNILFMSSRDATDPVDGSVRQEGDAARQAECIYADISTLLDAAGAELRHLVKTVEYVTPEGLPGYRGVAGVRHEHLAAPWPASTGIVSHSLLTPGLVLAVDPMAIIDGGAP